MYKTVQINYCRKVLRVTAKPCVLTSVPLTYVWAFGFVGFISKRPWQIGWPCQEACHLARMEAEWSINFLTFLLQKLTEPVLLLIMPLWIAPVTKHAVLGSNFSESGKAWDIRRFLRLISVSLDKLLLRMSQKEDAGCALVTVSSPWQHGSSMSRINEEFTE